MISAIAWVPKGASKRTPEKLKLSSEEIAMMHELAQQEAQEEKEMVDAEMEELDAEAARAKSKSKAAKVGSSEPTAADDLPPEFRMDEYDDEDDDVAIQNFINNGEAEGLHGSDSSEEEDGGEEGDDDEDDDAQDSGDLDINMDANAIVDAGDNDDEEYDKEDEEILPTDAVILVANTEDDFSNLEVQVYDENSGALYVHHEITLPAFPLSLAWMDCAPTAPSTETGPVDGSFVAVGTFKPGIEIWNLDVLDVLEPAATLGGEANDDLRNVAMPTMMGKKHKKKKGHMAALKPGSHQDAVMSLDWNSSHRNMLASGSADTTVKVWDVTTQTCLYTMSHHAGKVQAVKWNPAETTVIASAAFDKRVVVLDGRQPDAFSTFSLGAEVESIAWAPFDPSMLVASTEDGMVVAFDVRKNGSDPLFRINAHAGAVSSVSFSHKIPGMLATSGVDKTVKIWDLQGNTPYCVTSKDLNVGELLSMSFYQDSPFMLAAGGSKGMLALWDTSEAQHIEQRFSARIQGAQSSQVDLSSAFRSADQIADELMREEAAAKMQGDGDARRKKSKSKGKKK